MKLATLARAYWVRKPGVGELREESLTDSVAPGHSRVVASHGGISSGTERLVGLGQVPASAADRMRCNYMAGAFELPVKYGYALVGTAVDGARSGERLFAMHPHQSIADIRDEHATVLPPNLPAPRATLIPSLETALNAVWDAELRTNDRVLVLGAGQIGLLLAYVLAARHDEPCAVTDTDPERRAFAQSIPWIETVIAPAELEPESHQVVFHASGAPAGLQTALEAAGFEGTVVELSWYGDRPVELQLGTHFHYHRKRIVSSQVSSVAAPVRDQIDHGQRMQAVLELLDEPTLDTLVGPTVPFEDLPHLMAAIYRGPIPLPLPVIEYPCSA